MAKFSRHDGRKAGELRPVRITPGFVGSADGSCLVEMGGTRVICTACVAAGVPRWREPSTLGWLTAEYGMLPASTGSRRGRPGVRPEGRSVEIQRFIGRVLRSAVRFEKLNAHTVYLDCDVLEADGGTRTAGATGAWVALAGAAAKGAADGRLCRGAVIGAVAAVSVGIVEGKPLLDLDYVEDSAAQVDMNVAMTSGGRFVELQGTSERRPFTGEQLHAMLTLARKGIRKLHGLQRQAVKGVVT
jgi:ribonuclease PH